MCDLIIHLNWQIDNGLKSVSNMISWEHKSNDNRCLGIKMTPFQESGQFLQIDKDKSKNTILKARYRRDWNTRLT